MKLLNSCCTKYYKAKNNSRMTRHKYRDNISNRLFVAKETFTPKRLKLPILVLNLDGVLGYFDECKTYILREKSLQLLHSLSHNYRIVAYSHEPSYILKKLIKVMSEYHRPFIFDAVYYI